ncbi:hypothetical protein CHS0354_032836 [Potamilus streckersoni]|uniref:Death domain-containing protein n=1 Tax=Potamilus streckersoni TaxID=2493646 RepID=A0AAE0S9K4_9BIVA|nr:hypothetical protein CHS0354_032836 [Potamilus streckersoni]
MEHVGPRMIEKIRSGQDLSKRRGAPALFCLILEVGSLKVSTLRLPFRDSSPVSISHKDPFSAQSERLSSQSPSPYSKIISDRGLAELSSVISPGDLWQLLIFLGLTDDRIQHHHHNKGNLTIALAGKAALSEWRNNNIKAGEKELVRKLIQELECIGRVDVAEKIKSICKQNRYPSKTDFQH